MVTIAPGIVPPLWSTIVPFSRAVPWEKSGTVASVKNKHAPKIKTDFLELKKEFTTHLLLTYLIPVYLADHYSINVSRTAPLTECEKEIVAARVITRFAYENGTVIRRASGA